MFIAYRNKSFEPHPFRGARPYGMVYLKFMLGGTEVDPGHNTTITPTRGFCRPAWGKRINVPKLSVSLLSSVFRCVALCRSGFCVGRTRIGVLIRWRVVNSTGCEWHRVVFTSGFSFKKFCPVRLIGYTCGVCYGVRRGHIDQMHWNDDNWLSWQC